MVRTQTEVAERIAHDTQGRIGVEFQGERYKRVGEREPGKDREKMEENED